MIEILTLEDLLAAAEAALGRPPKVRDCGLLESALARPQATVFGQDAYPDLHGKAAALLSSLVMSIAEGSLTDVPKIAEMLAPWTRPEPLPGQPPTQPRLQPT